MEFKIGDIVYEQAIEFNNGNPKPIELKAIINEINDNLALIEYFDEGIKRIGYKFK